MGLKILVNSGENKVVWRSGNYLILMHLAISGQRFLGTWSVNHFILLTSTETIKDESRSWSSRELATKYLASHPDVAHKYSQQQPASSQRRRQGVEKKRPRPKSRVFGGGMLFPPSEVGPPGLPSETELEPMMQYPTAHHVRKHSGFGELKDRPVNFKYIFFLDQQIVSLLSEEDLQRNKSI
jgi:hypothetical protein